MHYVDHLLECPIGPSLKVGQLRRFFTGPIWRPLYLNFFGAARHPCVEVSAYNKYLNKNAGAIYKFTAGRFTPKKRPIETCTKNVVLKV